MEKWKPIPDFPGYTVSDQGRVRSYFTRKKSKNWYITDKHQRCLSPSSGGSQNYLGVGLRNNGKTHRRRIAGLVLLAFVGPRPDGHVVCHSDGDPQNDYLENLRYDTQKGNMADRTIEERYATCHRLLTDRQVLEIRCRYAAGGITHKKLATEYNVSEATVSYACRGQTFPHIGGPITKTGIPPEIVRAVLLRLRYETASELAEEYCIHRSTISRWKNGSRRRNDNA